MLWLFNLVFVGLLIVGAGVSDPFACSWDSSPPTELLCPALLWGFVLSLLSSWYATFVVWLLSLGGLPFPKGTWRSSGLGGGVRGWSEWRLWLGCIVWKNNKQKRDFFYLNVSVLVCTCMCAWVPTSVQKPKDFGSLGAGVTGICRIPGLLHGSRDLKSSPHCSPPNTLNFWPIFVSPLYWLLDLKKRWMVTGAN